MNDTPQWLRDKWASEPKPVCARANSECSGRMTKEHAFLYAGKSLQEDWACVDLCWFHHLGPGLNKKENQRIAVNRATKEDLAKFPRKNWNQYT